MSRTRRDFLKTAGVSAVAITSSPLSQAIGFAVPTGDSPGKLAKAWLTDDDHRLSKMTPPIWSAARFTPGQDAVVVDTKKTLQPLLGFGACFTDGSCYLLNELTPASREALFHSFFHPEEMNLNVCRICIGSADHAASVYSFDDGDPDPELKRFSIDHDRAYIIPILRQARQVNPDLFLFGSPWSPPGWMKDNNSMLGGCMRHTYMPSYAKYFVKFLRSYEAAGIPVQAITVQNEVDADQQGLMPACFWPQDYEADFVALHLGPEFERSGVKTKIWIIDHNYNLWGRAIAELETPETRKYTNSVAWHGYSGKPEWMMRVQSRFPDVEMHWTEGSTDYNDPEYLKNWASWASTFATIFQNGCRSITAWCFATDDHGKPNVGPYPCGGLVTVDSKTKEVYRGGQFWAMAHYSRFLRRGALRVESQSGAKDLSHCAFRNPDHSTVVVVTNLGPARICEIQVDEKAATLSLPANSVVSLVREDTLETSSGGNSQ
jgi:glucosylceramidase